MRYGVVWERRNQLSSFSGATLTRFPRDRVTESAVQFVRRNFDAFSPGRSHGISCPVCGPMDSRGRVLSQVLE